MKFLIHTYGCQMNIHESEKIAGILEQLGNIDEWIDYLKRVIKAKIKDNVFFIICIFFLVNPNNE